METHQVLGLKCALRFHLLQGDAHRAALVGPLLGQQARIVELLVPDHLHHALPLVVIPIDLDAIDAVGNLIEALD